MMKKLSSFLLATAIGCGGGSGPEDEIDPGDIDGPELVGSSVENDQTGVGAGEILRFTLSEALDPASLEEARVVLLGLRAMSMAEYQNLPRYPVDIRFDESTNTLEVEPLYPMAPDTRHTLRIEGLTDLNGNAMAPIERAFRVANTQPELGVHRIGGNISSYHRATLDDEGYINRVTHYGTAGADTDWFTEDDTITSVVRLMRSEKTDRRVYYTDPGADLDWNTDDDVLFNYSFVTRTETGTIQGTATSPGADGVWFTDDDTSFGYNEVVTDENGFRHEVRSYTTGADLLVGTADDDLNMYVRYYYDDMFLIGTLFAFAPGADGIWHTDDDVGDYNALERDERGLVVRQRRFGNVEAGEVGTEMTANIDGIFAMSYQDLRHLVTVSYQTPGADLMWDTSDDQASVFDRREYDADGNAYRQLHGGVGVDGIYNTADDENWLWTENNHDENGNLESTITFDDAASDGKIFTADDEIAMEASFVIVPPSRN